MKVALVNPSWSFEGSIYFGCREPHLPLELGYCASLLAADGHEARIFDGALDSLSNEGLAQAAADFAPDMTVVTTAPTYLFWRCAPPELRVPREFIQALGSRGGATVAVGPHGSVTPEVALRKLGVDIVVRGECEEVVAALARSPQDRTIAAIAYSRKGDIVITGEPHVGQFVDLPALDWPERWIRRHAHHHHRFDREPTGPGAETEASRGCPYHCSFCAKIDFRDSYRRRELTPLLGEIDDLIAKGAVYVYFIDEIFLPRRDLLEALTTRKIEFGIQTRIDLWKPEMIDLLGAAGCVSIEAGVESLTVEGRAALDKNCRISTDDLAARLIYARGRVPFVQANLIKVPEDDPKMIEDWRDRLRKAGVWANDPVPLYPYPSSPDYRRLWGTPDARAWERAHHYYLSRFDRFSDIQGQRPRPLEDLESTCPRA